MAAATAVGGETLDEYTVLDLLDALVRKSLAARRARLIPSQPP
jgi:hypothetical protein